QTLRMSISPRPPISACSRSLAGAGSGRWRGSKGTPSSRKVNRTESSSSRTSRERVVEPSGFVPCRTTLATTSSKTSSTEKRGRPIRERASRALRSSSNAAANPWRVAASRNSKRRQPSGAVPATRASGLGSCQGRGSVRLHRDDVAQRGRLQHLRHEGLGRVEDELPVLPAEGPGDGDEHPEAERADELHAREAHHRPCA